MAEAIIKISDQGDDNNNIVVGLEFNPVLDLNNEGSNAQYLGMKVLSYIKSMNTKNPDSEAVDIDDVVDLTSLMAQELQEFCDEAERAGTPLEGVTELLTEWETLYSRL